MSSNHVSLFSSILLVCVAPAIAANQRSLDAVPKFERLDSIEARVQGCVTCHGQQGQGTANGYFPRIAGKPAGYLYNQLAAFRDGTRSYPPMNYLVAYLPDPYLKEIAQHFASLRPQFQPREKSVSDPAASQRGMVLATVGDASKGVPACISCHGKNLTGMEPGIPGLAGLRSAYIAGQLTRWRVGERTAAHPDCMERIAKRLSEPDITAVAGWLAQQVPPADASPEPSNLVRMPLACGSQR
ncbi:c-type cytochrome [Massilia sp. RP-1-19]|uniref:C-type cytochrome n=1 Tax=Massilia polaris TaxID=2728846 RepID=A0A848HPH0_9BURK|nr:c-type cytochrome [Massilia polaris]NML61143.1 c-type cytochrome [Massilia polaris]